MNEQEIAEMLAKIMIKADIFLLLLCAITLAAIFFVLQRLDPKD